jgi:hypothetical protein
MDDFEALRDRYEEALDEAEERRREYLEAVQRAGADGKDVDELAAATGMTPSRVSNLLEVGSRSRGWMWRLALLLVLPLIAGFLLIENDPWLLGLEGSVQLEDEAAASTLAARLRAVPAIEEVSYGRSSLLELGQFRRSRNASLELPDPGQDPEVGWVLRFRTDPLETSARSAVHVAVLALIPDEGTMLYYVPFDRGILFGVGSTLVAITILGWLIAGVVALVRFVRRRWRIVRIDPVTT